MQIHVLLSVKPEYAERIFEGTKRYEFRRQLFRSSNVKKVLVYASSPVQMVIGEFEIDKVISSSPKKLWELTKNYAGISKKLFEKYFHGKPVAHAIKIKNVTRYPRPLNLNKTCNVSRPPQSFAYIAV